MPKGEKTIERFQPTTGAMQEIMSSLGTLTDMYDSGVPSNREEMRKRINEYFELCNEQNIRPGLESLSLCLGISRTTFWRWSNGQTDEKWKMEECERARCIINSSLEQMSERGQLNPVTSIFLLKNWANYSDSVPEPTQKPLISHQPSLEEIRAKYGLSANKKSEIIDIDVTDNKSNK